MALYVDKAQLERNAGLRRQWQTIVNNRQANWHHEDRLAQAYGMQVNEARIPADVWRDFDTQTKALMTGDEGGALLADLLPLARNVHIGKIVSEHRRYGDDEMEVRTSIDGQHAKPVHSATYDYDGTLVLVHSTQVGRTWRELEGMRSEGYDALLDDQAVATRFVRRRTLDNFVNGSDLTYKGYTGHGIKGNPNTLALELGSGGLDVDMTSPTLTQAKAQSVVVAILQAIQGNGNDAEGEVTLYVSSQIWFNLLRVASDAGQANLSILDALSRVPGVKAIKSVSVLSGNEILGVIVSDEYIRPIVGMPVTSTPIARATPMDDWHALVWGASGLQIKADAAGRSGVLFAAASK